MFLISCYIYIYVMVFLNPLHTLWDTGKCTGNWRTLGIADLCEGTLGGKVLCSCVSDDLMPAKMPHVNFSLYNIMGQKPM